MAAPASTQASSKATSAKREILGPFDKPAVRRIEMHGGDPRRIEVLQQRGLRIGPLVGVPASFRHQPCDGTACHRANGLNQHLESTRSERRQRIWRVSSPGSVRSDSATLTAVEDIGASYERHRSSKCRAKPQP